MIYVQCFHFNLVILELDVISGDSLICIKYHRFNKIISHNYFQISYLIKKWKKHVNFYTGKWEHLIATNINLSSYNVNGSSMQWLINQFMVFRARKCKMYVYQWCHMTWIKIKKIHLLECTFIMTNKSWYCSVFVNYRLTHRLYLRKYILFYF